MPKIFLKPNSPEFEDNKPAEKTRSCEMPGCFSCADSRAPKDRSLSEYYWFCQEHAREYNQAWNYFADMSDAEVQQHMKEQVYGHRPTWKYGVGAEYIDELQRKAWQTYTYSDEPPNSERYKRTSDDFVEESTPENDALKIMELTPPITLEGIKKRYKELAKAYHPDFNPGNKEAEDRLKEVNMAYTILKVAYEKYERFEKLKNS